MVNKKNMFAKARNMTELEDMYMEALEANTVERSKIESNYIERKIELLGKKQPSIEIVTEPANVSPVKGTKQTKQTTQMKAGKKTGLYTFAWVAGNQEMPAFTPVFPTYGKYSPVPQSLIRYKSVISGAYIRDYTPIAEDGFLYVRDVDKLRDVVEIEQDIEIRVEEGEDVQLKTGFFSMTHLTEVYTDSEIKNGYTVAETLLINPVTKNIRWKVITMFALKDDEIIQLPFTPA